MADKIACLQCGRTVPKVQKGRCRACIVKEWRQKNPDKHKAIAQRYYAKVHKKRLPMPQRFECKYDKPNGENGCWIWRAAKEGEYGTFHYKDGPVRAHRVAYMIYVGAIPQGLVLDHLCRNKLCVNPKHLEPVTNLENFLRGNRGNAGGKAQKARTHCPYGHPYSKENTYLHNNHRFCRTCNRERAAARKSKQQI